MVSMLFTVTVIHNNKDFYKVFLRVQVVSKSLCWHKLAIPRPGLDSRF